MSRQIHPTAIVDPTAELEENVTVGAYSVVGPGVSIGGDTELFNHVTVAGPTTIG
ncbi:MAG: acyl-[acyl-carrier-protein]--UDP-N-acetylglucosamine O-acyltransferase, partial [SAR324 cluster bacterium]|nr:acyl-[acyl-carrier-protein]--UDP-N-acetylglucosamine O-acyltransferase [SAR324 cluster bacterium]